MSSSRRGSTLAVPASVFAALGDATRLHLVSRLSDGRPHSITQLTDGLGQTRQGVTKHLDVLQAAGIVASTHEGRERHFVFTPDALIEARTYLERAAEQWDAAVSRLRAFVET